MRLVVSIGDLVAPREEGAGDGETKRTCDPGDVDVQQLASARCRLSMQTHEVFSRAFTAPVFHIIPVRRDMPSAEEILALGPDQSIVFRMARDAAPTHRIVTGDFLFVRHRPPSSVLDLRVTFFYAHRTPSVPLMVKPVVSIVESPRAPADEVIVRVQRSGDMRRARNMQRRANLTVDTRNPSLADPRPMLFWTLEGPPVSLWDPRFSPRLSEDESGCRAVSQLLSSSPPDTLMRLIPTVTNTATEPPAVAVLDAVARLSAVVFWCDAGVTAIDSGYVVAGIPFRCQSRANEVILPGHTCAVLYQRVVDRTAPSTPQFDPSVPPDVVTRLQALTARLILHVFTPNRAPEAAVGGPPPRQLLRIFTSPRKRARSPPRGHKDPDAMGDEAPEL